METNLVMGSVIFAGAGPGDPELLTIKAMRALQQAEVIIADRLVASSILDEFASTGAKIIRVGKQSGKKGSMPQARISALILEHALLGKRVVRLKGGDISIFSNIYNELQLLYKNQVPFELIPGISAAAGAAAGAGIPLTARNYADSVRFLTSYEPGIIAASQWAELASTKDTLVFYMSSEVIDGMIEKLINAGISEEVHIAIIEQASTPRQHTTCCTIHSYNTLFPGKKYTSPALVIIGRVAALHSRFAWFKEGPDNSPWFQELDTLKEAEILMEPHILKQLTNTQTSVKQPVC